VEAAAVVHRLGAPARPPGWRAGGKARIPKNKERRSVP
jgi:hypothetical protein